MIKVAIVVGLMFLAAQGGIIVFALAFVALPFILPDLFDGD